MILWIGTWYISRTNKISGWIYQFSDFIGKKLLIYVQSFERLFAKIFRVYSSPVAVQFGKKIDENWLKAFYVFLEFSQENWTGIERFYTMEWVWIYSTSKCAVI